MLFFIKIDSTFSVEPIPSTKYLIHATSSLNKTLLPVNEAVNLETKKEDDKTAQPEDSSLVEQPTSSLNGFQLFWHNLLKKLDKENKELLKKKWLESLRNRNKKS